MPTVATDCCRLQNSHKLSAVYSAFHSTDTKGSLSENKAIGPETTTHLYGVPMNVAKTLFHTRAFIILTGTNFYTTMYSFCCIHDDVIYLLTAIG
jgi:hypothetical protein